MKNTLCKFDTKMILDFEIYSQFKCKFCIIPYDDTWRLTGGISSQE